MLSPERIRCRLEGDKISDERLNEYIKLIEDRLCIRLETSRLPSEFYSICVDAVVKMHRRFYYEGISSENDGGISVSFADDVLSEYTDEIQKYKSRNKAVRFL